MTPTQHFTEPPPRFTEATLIKALEEHGIGRPSTYAATISTIVDRGYVRVEERRLRPEPVAGIVTDLLVEHFGDYVDLEFTARMEEELDEVARGEREWVPLLRAFYGPLRDRVDEKRRELKRADFTTEATDEVCSEGHPMVIRLGRNGRFLACSMFPDHKETRPLPGEEPPPQEGTGEVCPECGEGTLVEQARPVRAVRRLLALPGLQVHQEGRPAAAGPAAVRGGLPEVQRGPPRPASRAAHRQRLLGMLALPASATTPRTTSRSGGLHDADDGPVARKGDAALCLKCGAAIEAAPDVDRAGRALRRRTGRTRRRSPARRAAGGRPRAAASRQERRPRRGPARSGTRSTRPTDTTRRTGRGRVSGVALDPATSPALDRFLRALAARDASPHTQRSYATAIGAYLDWLGGARDATGARPARGDLRAYLAVLGAGRRALVGRAAARGDPLVLPLGGAGRAGAR